MNRIELSATSDNDGVIRLEIPVDQANHDYRVVIEIAESPPDVERDANGWPIGFFERITGKWVGELERPPQCEHEAEDRQKAASWPPGVFESICGQWEGEFPEIEDPPPEERDL
jgi:hypothetical protein